MGLTRLNWANSPSKTKLKKEPAVWFSFSRSSHRRCSIRPATLSKKRLQHGCFLVSIAKFLRTPTMKNICGRLLLFFSEFMQLQRDLFHFILDWNSRILSVVFRIFASFPVYNWRQFLNFHTDKKSYSNFDKKYAITQKLPARDKNDII